MDLKGKTVVLTGASTGIGAATALELSRAGCNLVLTSRRLEKLEALASTLPGPSVLLAADIAEAGTPEQLLALAKEG
ncbi:SDR family NAD(P)-dependent oxidoreductase, partial [Escherichia coli]|nr:SDR family NAD(P)-dependent oxidoreductase [Escherichia coli]